MDNNAAETLIGAVVLAVAGGFLIFAANTADLGGAGGGYDVIANFRKAEGVSVGTDVRLAGVKIGSVAGMGLDPKTYQAKVTISVEKSIKLPDDSAAKIASASLLGDSYISIEPGASDTMIPAGGQITQTQSSVSFSELLAKFVQGTPGK